VDRARKAFEKKADELQASYQEAAGVVEAAGEDPDYRAALGTLGAYQDFFDRFQGVGRPLLFWLTLVASVALVVRGVLAQRGRKLSLLVSTVCAGGVLAALLTPPVGLERSVPLLGDVVEGPRLPPEENAAPLEDVEGMRPDVAALATGTDGKEAK